MQITLNEEEWHMSDDTTVMEVLAEVSERATTRQHVVTRLAIGGRTITDRELQPVLLDRRVKEVGAVRATSQPVAALYSGVRERALGLGIELRAEAAALLPGIRSGRGDWTGLDAWLGRLADYVEAVSVGLDRGTATSVDLMSWIEQLLWAREHQDVVRVADLLQYEIVPRLPEDAASTV